MNTFIGNTEARADEKGRIFVPAAYRKILAEAGSKHIIMRRDTDNECLVFYPEQVWNEKVQSLRSALDEWDPEDQLILMEFMADAEILDFETIGASQDVLFVGMLDRFAMWNPQTFAERRAGSKELADKIRERMHRAAKKD